MPRLQLMNVKTPCCQDGIEMLRWVVMHGPGGKEPVGHCNGVSLFEAGAACLDSA